MYVLLAKTVYSVLRKSGRIPIYLHRKSNHIFITVWQHIVVLLTIKNSMNARVTGCSLNG
jgi:hypothetical protein